MVLKQLECMWDFNYHIHILWCISGDKAECIWEKIYYITGNLIFSLIQDNLITLNLNICGDFCVPNFVVEKWSVFILDRGKPRASALNSLSFWSIASARKEQTVLKLWGTLRIYFGLETCRLAILTILFYWFNSISTSVWIMFWSFWELKTL